MTRIWRFSAVAAAAALLGSGCLLMDERHTWYLDADTGAVVWTVLTQDVRSDARTAADRDAEELAFWNEVRAENHPAARAFRQLGAGAVRTRALRPLPPFSIVTEGEFPTLDALGRGLLAETGLTGTCYLERDASSSVWTLTLRDPHAEDDLDSDDDVAALLSAFDTLRVVLVRGRFESASGFQLSGDRRVATISLPEDVDENVMVVLQLRWTVDGRP